MTGEDLDLVPSTAEQARFECSPLGNFFNKGVEEDKKVALLKTLKILKIKMKSS